MVWQLNRLLLKIKSLFLPLKRLPGRDRFEAIRPAIGCLVISVSLAVIGVHNIMSLCVMYNCCARMRRLSRNI